MYLNVFHYTISIVVNQSIMPKSINQSVIQLFHDLWLPFILVYNPVYPRTPPGATVNHNNYTLLRCKVVFKNNIVLRHQVRNKDLIFCCDYPLFPRREPSKIQSKIQKVSVSSLSRFYTGLYSAGCKEKIVVVEAIF